VASVDRAYEGTAALKLVDARFPFPTRQIESRRNGVGRPKVLVGQPG